MIFLSKHMVFFKLLFGVSENRAYRRNPHPLKIGDLNPNQNFDQNIIFSKISSTSLTRAYAALCLHSVCAPRDMLH